MLRTGLFQMIDTWYVFSALSTVTSGTLYRVKLGGMLPLVAVSCHLQAQSLTSTANFSTDLSFSLRRLANFLHPKVCKFCTSTCVNQEHNTIRSANIKLLPHQTNTPWAKLLFVTQHTWARIAYFRIRFQRHGNPCCFWKPFQLPY